MNVNYQTLLAFLKELCVEDGLDVVPRAVNEWISKVIDIEQGVVSENIKEQAHHILLERKFLMQLNTAHDYEVLLLLEFNARCREKRVDEMPMLARLITKPNPLAIEQKSEAVGRLVNLLCELPPQNV